MFLNSCKTLFISPLFHTDFKEKAELFNTYFAKQFSLIKNYRKLPPQLHFLSGKCLAKVKLVYTEILMFIQNLNSNKVHGHHSDVENKQKLNMSL